MDIKNGHYSEVVKYELGMIESFLGNINEAKKQFSSYQGPFDERCKLEIGRISVAEENYNTARDAFNSLINIPSQRAKAMVEKLYLSIKLERFKESEKLLESLKVSNVLKTDEFNNIDVFIKYKLGKVNKDNVKQTYFTQQLFDYDYRRTIKYMSKKISMQTRFYENYDETKLEDVYKKVQETIKNMKPYRIEFTEYYIVDLREIYNLPDVGIASGLATSKVKVGVISNTKNIISIKPIMNIDNIKKYYNEQKKSIQRKKNL